MFLFAPPPPPPPLTSLLPSYGFVEIRKDVCVEKKEADSSSSSSHFPPFFLSGFLHCSYPLPPSLPASFSPMACGLSRGYGKERIYHTRRRGERLYCTVVVGGRFWPAAMRKEERIKNSKNNGEPEREKEKETKMKKAIQASKSLSSIFSILQ